MAKIKPFKVRPFDQSDKAIRVDGPADLRISVDNDDVNSLLAQAAINRMVSILNAGWTDEVTRQVEAAALRRHLRSDEHRRFCEDDCTAREELAKLVSRRPPRNLREVIEATEALDE